MKEHPNPLKFRADDIQAFDGSQAIRMRPQLYFEECYQLKSLNPLILEMCCHAFDEFFDNHCTKIAIQLNRESIDINYDAGMNLHPSTQPSKTIAECLFTVLYACSNLKKHLAVGQQHCKVGIYTVNAITEWCKLTTISNGQKGQFEFQQESIIHRKLTTSSEIEQTRIHFKIDQAIFPNFKYDTEGLQTLVNALPKDLASLRISIN